MSALPHLAFLLVAASVLTACCVDEHSGRAWNDEELLRQVHTSIADDVLL